MTARGTWGWAGAGPPVTSWSNRSTVPLRFRVLLFQFAPLNLIHSSKALFRLWRLPGDLAFWYCSSALSMATSLALRGVKIPRFVSLIHVLWSMIAMLQPPG